MRDVLVGALAAALLVGSVAGAEKRKGVLLGEISVTMRTITDVLEKAPCDPRWLSQAVKDSGLTPTELDKLQIGEKIYLNTPAVGVPSCKLPPTKSIIQESERLLSKPAPPKAPEKRAEAPAPAPTPAPPTVDPNLESNLDRANKHVAELQAEVRYQQWVSLGMLLVGFILGLLPWQSVRFKRWLKKRHEAKLADKAGIPAAERTNSKIDPSLRK
ncbi:hypothetical protein KW807_01245 [Candidatus Parcubacteria bacterium]|nr:hypothetical protein [Candidatus Parcubacteria bacterium]